MANYTAEEVQTAVEKVIRSTVRNPTGSLGERQVDTSFNDLQEAAAGVYILYYNAPFYTVYLGTTRLVDAAQTQAQTLSALIDAVYVVDRLVAPVSDISPIANARVALQELESAAVARAGGFSDITTVPAFRRYAAGIDKFIDENGGAVKGMVLGESGLPELGIVDTPAGARSKIPALVRQLRDQHDELIRRARLLAGALEDFAAMNLPRVAAQGIISRARQVLDTRYDELAPLSDDKRLENLRAVVLDLLTQRPLVEQYGAASAPTQYLTTRDRAVAYSDSTHPATPAALVSAKFGPYGIVEPDHMMRFTLDGGVPFDYPLPLAMVAELTGTLTMPFQAFSSDSVRVDFGDPDGVMTTYNVSLPPGTPSEEDILLAFNTAFGLSTLLCEGVFSPKLYESAVVVTQLSPTEGRFTVMAGTLLGFNIALGNSIEITSGPDAGRIATITVIDPAGTYVDATITDVVPQGLPDGAMIQIGAKRALRLRDTDGAGSVQHRRAIRIPATGGVEDVGATKCGWYPGAEMRSRPVAAKDLAANITASSAVMSASVSFSPELYVGRARSYVSDAGRIVLSTYVGDGVCSAGTTVSVVVPEVLSDVAGSLLVIRSTTTPADLNREGIISTFTVSGTTTTLVATFSPGIAGGGVGIEIGPDVMFFFGDVLNITGGPNQGRYVVREDSGVGTTCSLEVLCESAIPVPMDGAEPIYFDVEMGHEGVSFNSRSSLNTSKVVVESPLGGHCAEHFFTLASLPASAAGTTPYLRFTTFPVGAQVGDVMQLFETDFAAPSRSFNITSLEQGAGLVKVNPDMEVTADISFAFNTVVPFGRIRVAKVADFATLSNRLLAWLALPEQQDMYFRQLTSVLNPLLSNANPTAAQVNNAVSYLKRLLGELTISGAGFASAAPEATLEYALANYTAPAEEPVDTLLATFRHKGADRAIDLLLEGQFSTFFGLSSDGVSYSGQLLTSIRALGREDLPVRKFGRERVSQTLIGQSPEQKDLEFSTDDADSPLQPDIPVGNSIGSPGDSY